MISTLALRRKKEKEEEEKSASNILKVCGKELEEVRVLGVGGQGSVSLCKDTDSGILFALKTAAAAAADDLANEYDTVRFLMDSGIREGIIQVHGIDEHKDSGELCVLMDFCDGGDLMSELKRHSEGRLEDRQAAAVLRSVSESLSRCHDLGVMHRDIKPENILLRHAHHHARVGHGAKRRRGRRGNVDSWPHDLRFVLADFGLSCEFHKGHRIKDGYVVGTNQYIAPEMVKGAYDERADVWSLGILLHLLLTGDFPPHIRMVLHHHERYDANTLLLRAMESCPDEIDVGAPMYSRLSEGARSLLAGMLRKNPRDRFTAQQVRAHPWLHPLPTPHAEDIEEDTFAPHRAALSGFKRVRFTMAGFQDIVREVQVPEPAVVGPLIVPEEVQLLEFNPLAMLAAC